GTSTTVGTKRMPRASTSTVVICPDAVTPASAGAALDAPTAAGSAATPPATARTTVARPAAASPARRAPVVVSAPGSAGAYRALRAARTARTASGRNEASATSTTTDAITRTRLGTGSTQTSRPALAATIRAGQPRSNMALVARTAVGPPPRTTGTRDESAPRSTWAVTPASRGA